MALSTDVNKIRQYYSGDAEREWDRHERHRFEFPLTMHFLTGFLKPESRILDIGGGPGRYTLALTEAGHRVTLFDLAEGNIDFAKKKAEEHSLEVNDYVLGDARDLSAFEDGEFDAVLVMGPLYHLNRIDDRSKVLSEAVRVLKPGGFLLGACLSHFAPIYDLVRKNPEDIGRKAETLLRYLKEGTYITDENIAGFVDAFFFDPDKIVPFFSSFGLEKRAFFGAESLIGLSETVLINTGENVLAHWIDFACRTAETKAAIYGSDHLIYIGEKGLS